MHMKYFQAIADIERHYDDVIAQMERPQLKINCLNSWGITLDEKEQFIEEREVLRYLIGCQLGLVHGQNVHKPSLEVVERCFSQQLKFLDDITNCNATNFRNHHSVIIRKEYMACRHYLFKFSLPAWYKRLPEVILTFENKYKNMG